MTNQIDHQFTQQIQSILQTTQPTEFVERGKAQENSQPNQQTEKVLPKEDAQVMTESINQFLTSTDSQLRFVFHDQLNEYYVTIINSATNEVIKEVPSKKMLDIHAAMKEFVGLLLDRKI